MTEKAKGQRVYFLSTTQEVNELFIEKVANFTWFMGQNWQQRQKSIVSFHETIQKQYPNKKILEVSTKSHNYTLGKSLSAFNLKLHDYSVENIFQSSKVLNDGGPYTDILNMTPADAKKDPRIKIDSKSKRYLKSFIYNKKDWPIEPKSLFYDSIYISALLEHPDLCKNVMHYSIFTDIEFNQKEPYATKGPFNCQARSVAIYVSFINHGYNNKEIKTIIENPDLFVKFYFAKPSQISFIN